MCADAGNVSSAAYSTNTNEQPEHNYKRAGHGQRRGFGTGQGEIGLNTALASHHGAPVVMLSGDDAACAELLDPVPGASTAAVKRALGQAAAEAMHLAVVRDCLRHGAAAAIARRT